MILILNANADTEYLSLTHYITNEDFVPVGISGPFMWLGGVGVTLSNCRYSAMILKSCILQLVDTNALFKTTQPWPQSPYSRYFSQAHTSSPQPLLQ
jgi:hypothetical protein